MAKYLRNNGGILTETNTVQSSAGAGDADKVPSLDSGGKLDSSMMPVGLAADSVVISATENLAAGDFVNIYDATGAKCRKADATAIGKQAHGYVLAAVTSGQNATIYFDESNNQVTGKTPGATQYLSATTPGATTETAPTTAGQIVQSLGMATSATNIHANILRPIVLA